MCVCVCHRLIGVLSSIHRRTRENRLIVYVRNRLAFVLFCKLPAKVCWDLSICNHIKMTELLQVHKLNTKIDGAHQINLNMNTNQQLDTQHITSCVSCTCRCQIKLMMAIISSSISIVRSTRWADRHWQQSQSSIRSLKRNKPAVEHCIFQLQRIIVPLKADRSSS